MHVRTAILRGRRRRLALLAPIAVVVAIGGLAVVNSGAGATSGPQQVPAPTEPANQLTVNVAADGTLTLPFRSTLACDVSFCPPGQSYTDIAPGKTDVIINDPSGTRANIEFGKLFDRHVGPRNKTAHAKRDFKAGQLTVSVKIGKTKVARLVLVVIADPYASTTTTSFSETHHVVVTLSGGDGGDTGTLSVSPNPSQAGLTSIVLDDLRANKIGTPQLYLDVQPGLGHIALGRAGETVQHLMCPHDWIAYIVFPDGDGPTTTTIGFGATYGAHTTWSVDGTDSGCTTPIT